MNKRILLFICFAFLTFKNQAQTVTDIDGNVYNTVAIGTQVWLGSNLKTTKFNDGSAIPLLRDNNSWINLTAPGYCWYNNDSVNYKDPYGALYSWYTGITGKLCPSDWHVPSDAEWTALTSYLGGVGVAGGKLKEIGYSYWSYPNTGATNEVGFTARPGGNRTNTGEFYGINGIGNWWTSTDSPNSYNRNMGFDRTNVGSYDYKTNGFSVRCIRNYPVGINDLDYKCTIKTYPNPVVDIVHIDFTNILTVKMQLFNLFGKCILRTEFYNKENKLDISSLPKGIYIIKFYTNNWIEQFKLIKE